MAKGFCTCGLPLQEESCSTQQAGLGGLRSAVSDSLLDFPHIDVPGAGPRAATAPAKRRKRRVFSPRGLKREILFTPTGLQHDVLVSQCHDPVLREAARGRALAMAQQHRREKSANKRLNIIVTSSPYHAKAMQLLSTHRKDLPWIQQDAEPQGIMAESIRQAKYSPVHGKLPLRPTSACQEPDIMEDSPTCLLPAVKQDLMRHFMVPPSRGSMGTRGSSRPGTTGSFRVRPGSKSSKWAGLPAGMPSAFCTPHDKYGFPDGCRFDVPGGF
mmetsp:Transcript_129575/g.242428  ORF Transcript_129575/g.242428 Transcript_129575/m.242428 type:complete len:271 (-) Transcript_129575:87-899(-)